MNIHAITTGHVKITRNWREGKAGFPGRLINTLLDRNFTDWLPIYCFIIEHPDGLTVVDTGISANANDPVYFPLHVRLVQRAAPFDISPEEELAAQMQAIGLNPADVRRVILTHLHQDHDGGLLPFKHAEFIVSRREWSDAQGFSGRMKGYLPSHWFSGFNPTVVDFKSGAYASFATSEKIADSLYVVPTPGHSAGHLSVVLEQGSHALFMAGDAAYAQNLLLNDVIDGVGPDPQAQHDTHARIVELARRVPLVFLPSHDPDAAQRLANQEIITEAELAAAKTARLSLA